MERNCLLPGNRLNHARSNMNLLAKIFRTRTSRIAAVALLIVAWDQSTKILVLRFLPRLWDERIIIPNLFKLVHWQNTGAAWSLFTGNNTLLIVVAIIALVVLFLGRHHFDSRSLPGQTALGLIFGGITGNLIDRIRVGHVIDFIRFYLPQSNGNEIGFPAFNIADSGICIGVGLIFLLTWRNQEPAKSTGLPQ